MTERQKGLVDDLRKVLPEPIPYGEAVGAPYPYSTMGDDVYEDYRDQLISQAADLIEDMAREQDATATLADKRFSIIRELLARNAALETIKNAAVTDLVLLSSCHMCSVPKDNTVCIVNSNMQGKSIRPCEKFQWRGVVTENGGECK